MNNDSEILGEWANQGYFLKEYADHTVTVCYKDNGSRELAAIDRDIITPDIAQGICERHQGKLALAKVVPR